MLLNSKEAVREFIEEELVAPGMSYVGYGSFIAVDGAGIVYEYQSIPEWNQDTHCFMVDVNEQFNHIGYVDVIYWNGDTSDLIWKWDGTNLVDIQVDIQVKLKTEVTVDDIREYFDRNDSDIYINGEYVTFDDVMNKIEAAKNQEDEEVNSAIALLNKKGYKVSK